MDLKKLETDVANATAAVKKAEEALKQAKEEIEKNIEWPKIGDWYFWINGCCDIGKCFFNNDKCDKYRIIIGNCFRTKEEAELEKNIMLAREERFLPKVGERYYFVSFLRFIEWNFWDGDIDDIANYQLGNCHKTREDARKWREKHYDNILSKFN
jgi:hypothetical protein